MDDGFERKLRAAVSAGWRVLIVEAGLLTIVWVVYVVITVTLEAVAVYKVALWLQVALLAWGWLWASTLRQSNARIAEKRTESDRPTAGAPGSRTLPAQS